MKHWVRIDRMVITQACYGLTLQFSHHLSARVGGYNRTRVHSRIICSWMWNQPQTAGVYTWPKCECSCLESAVITAIQVATTASQVRPLALPLSLPFSLLISSSLNGWQISGGSSFSLEASTGFGKGADGPCKKMCGNCFWLLFFHQPLPAVQFTPVCPTAIT